MEEEEESKAGTEVDAPSDSEAKLLADEQPTPKVIKPAPKAKSKASSEASKSSKPSSRSKPLPSLPPSPLPPSVKSPIPSSRPLSQLDRFANIPPTSSPAPLLVERQRFVLPGRQSLLHMQRCPGSNGCISYSRGFGR